MRVKSKLGVGLALASTGMAVTAANAAADATKCGVLAGTSDTQLCFEVRSGGTAVNFFQMSGWLNRAITYQVRGYKSDGNIGWASVFYDASPGIFTASTKTPPNCGNYLGGPGQFLRATYVTPCHDWPEGSTLKIVFKPKGASSFNSETQAATLRRNGNVLSFK